MRREPRYGTQHDQARRQIRAQLNLGASFRCSCQRLDCPNHVGQCPTIIDRFSEWDLGHTDDGLAYQGPECRPCNRAAGARASNGQLLTDIVPDRF